MLQTAEEVMTKNPKTFRTNEQLRDVIDAIIKGKITSVPIVDLNGTVVGLLTEVAVIKACLLHQKKDTRTADPVGNYASHFETPVWVNEKDTITTVIGAMVKSATHRVLVRVGEGGKLRGIISPSDVVRNLLSS